MRDALRRCLVFGLVLVLVAPGAAWGQEGGLPTGPVDIGPCGEPPPPKPAQQAGSEGMPPLPIPAVPQRRSEKKKPPTPPTLVVKLIHGPRWDWATDPNDINNLLLWMQNQMKVSFGYEEKALSEVDLEAERPPMLYRTGHNAFEFSEHDRARLRQYIMDGGFIYFDACCGRQAFGDSVRRELELIFPERRLEKLPSDHPLYNCYFDVPYVEYTPYAQIPGQAPPPLEGIDIGCRTAVVFSPYDLSCGWDMHTHETNAGVQAKYALRLGANLVAYATATRFMGESLAAAKQYVDADDVQADKFRVGQVIHNGQWNPNVARLSTLLEQVNQTTGMQVSFEDQPVQLDEQKLLELPFLYMTGHNAFTLTDAEKAGLKGYLESGGFLLAESCCGRQSFDAAFRDTIAQVFPNARLEPIPLDHSIYSIFHRIEQVEYTDAAAARDAKFRGAAPPQLMGLTIDGHLAVVYSPVGLGNGWELQPNPFAAAYASKDSIRLGVNIVLHAVTH